MILVFDLDDTLYEEITFVRSAFEAVSKYLASKFQLNPTEIERKLLHVMEEKGRGAVFNDVLKEYGIYNKAEVKKCLSVYRTSSPNIELNEDALRCLKRFEALPKYLVTDGNKRVQTAKIEALNLKRHFKKTIPSHTFGIKHAKPSTYIFHKILEWEQGSPGDLVYIGDNPNKDFVNLKKEGFKTVRILTGMFKNVRLDASYEADYEIRSLDELNVDLLQKIFK
jgi:putative hydrolase of the HAD superfamily